MYRENITAFMLSISVALASAQANIDPFSGRLSEEFIDLEILGFQITRSTSVRPAAGLFGRTWCTNLDAKLEIEKNRIELWLCAEEFPLVYTRNSKGIFVSKDEREYVQQSQNGWTRVRSGSFEEMYNTGGQLIGMRAPWTELQIQRDTREIRVSLKNNPAPIVLKLDKNKTIESIQHQNTQVAYKYDQLGRLTEVKNMWDSLIQYKYDAGGRLAETRLRPAGQKEKVISLTYDGPTERVREARLMNDCVITAKYETKKEETSQQIQFENEFTEKCPNSRVVTKTFRRTFNNWGTEDQALIDESFKSETRSWKRNYDPKNGRLVSFEENGKRATVLRNNKNQVNQIAYTDGRIYKFSYDEKCAKVRSYTTSGQKKSRVEIVLDSSCEVESLRIGKDRYELGQYRDPKSLEFIRKNGKTIRLSDLSQPRSRNKYMSDQIIINTVDEALHWARLAEGL